MPWPPRVLSCFKNVPINPSEAGFHGPYNKLLCTMFPADSAFTVAPFYLPQEVEVGGFADLIFLFEVSVEEKPVLILELKAPGKLRYHSARDAADKQIRSRLNDMPRQSHPLPNQAGVLTAFDTIAFCPLPVLRGVCAMGTRLCFYEKPSGGEDHTPPYAIRSRNGNRSSTGRTLGL